MRSERSAFHQVHPHIAMHMPHPVYWRHEHQMASALLTTGLVILLMAGMTFLIYRLGQYSGTETGTLMSPQLLYYPFY